MKRLITVGVVGAWSLAACSTSESSVVTTVPASDLVTAQSSIDPVATTVPVAVNSGFTFVSPTGDYSVIFPGEPTRTDLPIPLPGDVVIGDAYIDEAQTGAYFTSAFDYPDDLEVGDAELVLLGARDGAVENVGGALESSMPIERSGIPGIAFTFSIDGEITGSGSAVVFYQEPRLYQTFALGEVGSQGAFQTFVETFEFAATSATETDS